MKKMDTRTHTEKERERERLAKGRKGKMILILGNADRSSSLECPQEIEKNNHAL